MLMTEYNELSPNTPPVILLIQCYILVTFEYCTINCFLSYLCSIHVILVFYSTCISMVGCQTITTTQLINQEA